MSATRTIARDLSDAAPDELIDLQGRIAVITGAGQGIGAAIALRFADAGAHVLVTDADMSAAERVAAEVSARGGAATAFELDVRDASAIAAAAEFAETRLGGLDIWVNNAGIYPRSPALEMAADEWSEVFVIDFEAVLSGAQAAAKRMCAQGRGVIINVSSAVTRRGVADFAAYAAAKHAVDGMTVSFAKELAPFGVRVMGVAPGFTQTPGSNAARAATNMDGGETRVLSATPLGRLGEPDDVARVAQFCASGLAEFMTGVTLIVDGGSTA